MTTDPFPELRERLAELSRTFVLHPMSCNTEIMLQVPPLPEISWAGPTGAGGVSDSASFDSLAAGTLLRTPLSHMRLSSQCSLSLDELYFDAIAATVGWSSS